MADVEKNNPDLFCWDCGESPDGYCDSRGHIVVELAKSAPTKPDLTGTPAPQHDVRNF